MSIITQTRLDFCAMPTLEINDQLEFTLPPEREAHEPPEARGLRRDHVRLMISHRRDDHVIHTRFDALDQHLRAGDVLVINTSGTLNAALPATRSNGDQVHLHLSTQLPANIWIVEVRQPTAHGTEPFRDAQAGEILHLPNDSIATLLTPYIATQRHGTDGVRLWLATLALAAPLHEYLDRYGFPIRYNYVERSWSNEYYQTVYATERGSAEMPSAGRAFSHELITRLVAHGVQIAPLLLHTGVASLEDHEPPYEEWFRVPLTTANMVNTARREGRRVIAVGTTAVRALESVVDEHGIVHPHEGWTRLVITSERGIFSVDGLLTGLHEPRASHLFMLEALAERHHLAIAYAEALREGYLWHEFGDLHLII